MSIIKTLAGFSLLIWISMVSAEESPPSAYEMLEKFNFPKGILPEGVNRYVLHEDNRFEVYLNGDCKFQVEEGGYYLHYQKKISGRVEFGSLKDLQGVSVKILFMWIGITEVSSGGGDLSFYVGPMSASFPITNFEECPQCGGGYGVYNQNNNKMGKHAYPHNSPVNLLSTQNIMSSFTGS